MGSTESSDGSIFVRVMASPNIQLAKSLEKLSAKNLQILSIIAEFYHLRNDLICLLPFSCGKKLHITD